MTQEEIKREKIRKLQEILHNAHYAGSESEQAEFLLENGVELRGEAEWIKDPTYPRKDKTIYFCSHCNRWQAVRKPEAIKYKHYCDFCGYRMKVNLDDAERGQAAREGKVTK